MGARAGYHHNVGTIAGDTVSGAASGAAIGTAIAPGLGTAIGAGAGAIGGFITGLFTGDSPDAPPPPTAPPPPPDLVDEIEQRAALAKQSRMMADENAGVFLSGPLGDSTKAPGTAAKAGGV